MEPSERAELDREIETKLPLYRAAKSAQAANSTELCTELIRLQNDRLRQWGIGGLIVITSGIQERGEAFVRNVLQAVRSFSSFGPDNDPHKEHDFGSIKSDGETIFWKIDYYNADMSGGSEDPAEPEQTERVLTIMFSREY